MFETQSETKRFCIRKVCDLFIFYLISPHCIKFRLKFQKSLLKGGRKVWLEKADKKGVKVLVFPEMCVTVNKTLVKKATKVKASAKTKIYVKKVVINKK